MPGDIPPKGVAEKTLHIGLKIENLDERVRKVLIVTFAETGNMDSDSVSSEELWNWIKTLCQHCLYNSREGLCTHEDHSLEISETQIIPTDKDKLKWIQECHDSPVVGH
jgi:hypothetical protein